MSVLLMEFLMRCREMEDGMMLLNVGILVAIHEHLAINL